MLTIVFFWIALAFIVAVTFEHVRRHHAHDV
jgi:hypothetical protein